MTKQPRYNTFLRQISPGAATGSGQTHYPLASNQTTVIGRDPSSCQIVLDAMHYKGVSREHLEIRPQISQFSGGMPVWEICDRGSSNGTYINRQRLQSCHTLQVGDRIKLGQNGPEFIFDSQVSVPIPIVRPLPIQTSDSLHLSQMFPITSKKLNLRQKGYLIQGIITVLFIIAMFATVGSVTFFFVLAAYLTAAGFYFIYQLCGKSKPWWLLLGSALATGLTILLYLYDVPFIFDIFADLFYKVLPGYLFEKGDNIFAILLGAFCGPGLSEELFKALPVLLLYLLGRQLKSPLRERLGVWEPLDGILLGAASAAGFTFVETIFKYVPETIVKVVQESGQAGIGLFVGLTLLIPRILGDVTGHMAYSGYFGYFIGLSALKPSKRWQILGIGYLTSAAIHALWDAVAKLTHGATSNLLLALIGSLGYVFLIAAILKARQLSLSRLQNFATRFNSPNSP